MRVNLRPESQSLFKKVRWITLLAICGLIFNAMDAKVVEKLNMYAEECFEECVQFFVAPSDIDDDGLTDAEELTGVDDPSTALIPDGISNPRDACDPYPLSNPNGDCDKDGITNSNEILVSKTDPLNNDTDGDGLLDGLEGSKFETSALVADTDGGGVNDGIEIYFGLDPFDPLDDALPSSGCSEQINVSVDPQCKFSFRPDFAIGSGSTIFADSVYLRKNDGLGGKGYPLTPPQVLDENKLATTGSGAIIYSQDIGGTGSFTYEFYIGSKMVCWGGLLVENKNKPNKIIDKDTLICGMDADKPVNLDSIKAKFKGACAPNLSNFVVSTYDKGDVCTGLEHITQVRANYTIKGVVYKEVVYEKIDCYLPLDPKQVSFPDKITLQCGKTKDLSPAGISAYFDDPKTQGFNEGWAFGYPHIKRDTIYKLVIDEITADTQNIVKSLKVEKDITGDGIPEWVVVKVVDHVITYDTTYKAVAYYEAFPLRGTKETGVACKIATSYTDMEFAICGGKNIMRTWKVVDLCKSEFAEGTQWISFTDTEAPKYADINGNGVIDESEKMQDVITSDFGGDCSASYILPNPKFVDNCSNVTIKWVTTEGRIVGNKLVDLWNGQDARVTAIVKDECGNTFTDEFLVSTRDLTPPGMVLHDEIEVSLSSSGKTDGKATVPVWRFDLGSNDGGCDDSISLCAIRMENWNAGPIILNGEVLKIDTDGDGIGDKIAYPVVPGSCEHDGTITAPIKDKFGEITGYQETKYVICKESVKFCCEDVKKENMVVIFGFDKNGNSNLGMSRARVFDKSGNSIICPADVTITCQDDVKDLKITGEAKVRGTCAEGIIDYKDEAAIQQCSGGTIRRTWTLYDKDSNVLDRCVQKINIGTKGGFDPNSIQWPLHYTGANMEGINLECQTLSDGTKQVLETKKNISMYPSMKCSLNGKVERPEWCIPTCSLVAANYEDLVTEGSEACKGIIRRWTIIDWCTWQPNFGDSDKLDKQTDEFEVVENWLPGSPCHKGCLDADKSKYFRFKNVKKDGYYTFDQIIKVEDDLPPRIIVPDTIYAEVLGGKNGKTDLATCDGVVEIEADVIDSCGDMEFKLGSNTSWTVRVDNGSPVIKTGSKISMSVSGKGGETKRVFWSTADGCNNAASKKTIVIFSDNKAPTPVCKQNLSTSIMKENGSVELWAKDFDLGSFDNCGKVELSWSPKENIQNINFTCDDLNGRSQEVVEKKLYVHQADKFGQLFDFCLVSVLLRDNFNTCGYGASENTSAALTGGITHHTLGNLDNTSIKLNGFVDKEVKSQGGIYGFSEVPTFYDYKLSADRKDKAANGVSTRDLLFIQRHILGISNLNTLEQLASDVNEDGEVNISDIIEIRKMILGINEGFSVGKTWLFFDKKSLVGSNNSLDIKQEINIKALSFDISGLDFVGVKLGDVTGDVKISDVETRSLATQKIEINDKNLKIGEKYQLTLSLKEIAALQFTLNHAGLELNTINGKLITHENYNDMGDKTSFAWAETQAKDLDLVLEFTATKNVVLSEALYFSNDITKTELVDKSLTDKSLSLNYFTGQSEFKVINNDPNPFRDYTNINFVVPSEGKIVLKVSDVNGKILTSQERHCTKGNNSVIVHRNQLNLSSGIYFYTLEYNGKLISNKLVVID